MLKLPVQRVLHLAARNVGLTRELQGEMFRSRLLAQQVSGSKRGELS